MSKFEKKLYSLFWFIIIVLPLLLYFIMYFSTGTDLNFSDFISSYRFEFVANIFTDILNSATVAVPAVVCDFLSYFISVEIMHLFVDVVIFLPRFARCFMEGIYGKISR